MFYVAKDIYCLYTIYKIYYKMHDIIRKLTFLK